MTCNLGSLANAASATVTIIVTPNTPGGITNTATVAGNEADPNTANNTAQAVTTVLGNADLSVTKTDSPDPVTVGSNLTYTVTITNNGPDGATGVTLTDTLPAGVTFVSATPSQGSCGGSVTCNMGTINNGASATVTIVVTPNTPGSITNIATVAGNETDPNLANNTAQAMTTVNPAVASCLGTGSFRFRVDVAFSDQVPILGVAMTLTGPGGCTDTATTNARGRARFDNLGPGTYTVTPTPGTPDPGCAFTPASRTKTITTDDVNARFLGSCP